MTQKNRGLVYADFSDCLLDGRARNEAETIETDTGPDKMRGLGYVFDDRVARAISAAMTLSRPLLITGEPGCGKTELGFAIARALKDRPAVRHFTCRSAGEVQDIFYTYDAMARFHAVQVAGSVGDGGAPKDKSMGASATPFIKYAGLGQALLDAWGAPSLHEIETRSAAKAKRSVVIIDEIDKATRDFCNDLLEQLDRYAFEAPELAAEGLPSKTPDGEQLSRDKRPIVIIASNSEKLLPEPFLRRCMYHRIGTPSGAQLEQIVHGRLRREFDSDHRLAEGFEIVKKAFDDLRATSMSKKPGTAELIDASLVAVARLQVDNPPRSELLKMVLSALVKDTADMAAANRVLFADPLTAEPR